MPNIRTANIRTNPKLINTNYSNSSPVGALEEIVYNSLDASASSIDINIYTNELKVIDKITVVDNGKGFYKPNENTEVDPFLTFGMSNKRIGQTNDFNRLVHGRNGQGRFKSFALGNIVEWKTKTNKDSTRVTINIDNPLKPEIEDDVDASDIKTKTGTIFTAYANGKTVKIPPQQELKEILERFFLTIIEDKRVSITLNGSSLDISDHIEATSDIKTLPNPNEDVQMKTIVWKTTTAENNRLFWCDSSWNTILEDQLDDLKKTSNHSVYIAADRVANAYKENRLSVANLDPELSSIKSQAIELKNSFIFNHNKQKSEDIIQILKEDGIYPYDDDDKLSVSEEQTKHIYDKILIKLNSTRPSVFKSSTPQSIKRGIVNTIQLVIQRDPENFKDVLEKLMDLTPEEMQDFSDLLKEVSLNSIIKTSSTIQHRLKFLEGLRQIAYGELKNIKERSQLHKIIENETWIFGEKFNFLASDNSFSTIIKELRDGLKDFVGHDDIVGGDYIPDLFFARKCFSGDTPKALIVELKRPSVDIGFEEVTQIKKYYNTITSNAQFDKYEMDIIVVSSKIKPEAKKEIENKKTGFINYGVQDTPNKRLYIKTWADILNDNEQSLFNMKQMLNSRVDKEDGIKYLEDQYCNILKK